MEKDNRSGFDTLLPLPPHGSDSRDIDTRESWGDIPTGNSSVRRSHGLKLENPDFHEPSANFITVVVCLMMFALAVWWGSVQFQHATLPKELGVTASGENSAHVDSTSAGDAPDRP